MILAIVTLGFVLVVFKLKDQHGLYSFPTFEAEHTFIVFECLFQFFLPF